MNRVSIFLLLVVALSLSCNKNDPNISDIDCDSESLCFKVGDVPVTQPASWRTISANRIRIYWQTLDGNNYKNVEIDVWGTTTGTYSIKPRSSSSPSATFQYFVTDGSSTKNWQGESGTITISSTDNDKLAGSFKVSVKDTASGETKDITNGTFSDLPKK